MSYHINIVRIRAVANILSDFREQIVFVGGATVILYASRPELTTIRPTDDVDIVIELLTTGEFYLLQDKLLALGFEHDMTAPIISRFLYQGVKVDFMPTYPAILGFTNRWYKEGSTKDQNPVRRAYECIYFFCSLFHCIKNGGVYW